MPLVRFDIFCNGGLKDKFTAESFHEDSLTTHFLFELISGS
jgi:hypothetical protein